MSPHQGRPNRVGLAPCVLTLMSPTSSLEQTGENWSMIHAGPNPPPVTGMVRVPMKTAYRVFIARGTEVAAVLESALVIEYVNPGLSLTAEAFGDGYLHLSAGNGVECWFAVRTLGASEQIALSTIGIYEVRVDFAVQEITQESLGLCWDAVTSAAMHLNCSIWISVDLWDPSTIARVAPVRVVPFPDVGYVLTAAEFLRIGKV